MPDQPQLPGLAAGVPATEEDWLAKRIEISELFSPTAPVRETELFAGRTSQMTRIIDSIFQAGQHVVIYGDRGVGKTSLVNTVIQRVFANSKRVRFFSTQCFSEDDFVAIWERLFKTLQWGDGTYAYDDIDDTLDPDTLFDVIAKFNAATKPVFVFDEFDRITDRDTKLRMAETIKLLSDRSIDATIMIAGIARTITDLLAEHESVKRAIRQIEMPRMSEAEIRDLVTVRIGKAGMTITEDAVRSIIWLSRGMPGYAHLLGKYSANAAIDAHTLDVTDDHLFGSLRVCLDEAGESTRRQYAKAVQSARPKHWLKETLLACAIAHQDQFGAFMAADVRDPLSRITGKRREIPDFNRHLNAFCSEDRGGILEKEGSPKNYRYRFTDPMMQSYVITVGIADNMLPRTGEP